MVYANLVCLIVKRGIENVVIILSSFTSNVHNLLFFNPIFQQFFIDVVPHDDATRQSMDQILIEAFYIPLC